jgi:hypothetical protein
VATLDGAVHHTPHSWLAPVDAHPGSVPAVTLSTVDTE